MKIQTSDIRTCIEILFAFGALCAWIFFEAEIAHLEQKVQLLQAELLPIGKTPREKLDEEMYQSTNWDNLHPEKRALTEWLKHKTN